MRASPVLGPTPAFSPGTGHSGTRRFKPSQSPAVTITPTDACLTPDLPLGSCHQAEKTPKPHLLHNSSAFTETSILREQRRVSSHSPGVDFTLEVEEEFAFRNSFPVNTDRLWSHSPWSSQDPHVCLLNLHGWQARVVKQYVYQMAWNQIPGQVPLSEPRVSVLTAPTSCPLPISAQSLILSVLGSFLRAEPSTAPASFPCASDGHCDGRVDRWWWAPR